MPGGGAVGTASPSDGYPGPIPCRLSNHQPKGSCLDLMGAELSVSCQMKQQRRELETHFGAKFGVLDKEEIPRFIEDHP